MHKILAGALGVLMTASFSTFAAPPTSSGGTVPSTDSDGTYTITWNNVPQATYYRFREKVNGYWGTVASSLPAGTTRYTVTGRSPNTYYYIVDSCDSTGCAAKYLGSTVVTEPPPPKLPAPNNTAPSVSLSGTTVNISWAKPSGTISHYELKENGNLVYSGASRSTSRAHSATSHRGKSYSYQVRACNPDACSSWVSGSNSTVYIPHAAPNNVAPSVSLSGTTVNVSWGVPSGTISHYELKENGASVYNVSGTSTSINHSPTTHRGKSYSYQLRACNSDACSSWISGSSSSVYIPHATPNNVAPVASLSGTTVNVSWAISGGTISYYELKENGNTVYTLTNRSTSIPHSSDRGENFSYQLRACNSDACSAWVSGSSSSVYIPYTAPNNVAAVATLNGTDVEVSWAEPNGVISYYELKENDQTVYTVNGRSKVIPHGSDLGKTFTYALRACNVDACSSWISGTHATVTIPNAAPALPSVAVSLSGTDINVSWSSVTGAESYNIQENNGEVIALNNTSKVFSHADGRGQTYIYKVRSCNSSTCSAWVESSSITIPELSKLNVSISGSHAVDLGQGGAPIYTDESPLIFSLDNSAGISNVEYEISKLHLSGILQSDYVVYAELANGSAFTEKGRFKVKARYTQEGSTHETDEIEFFHLVKKVPNHDLADHTGEFIRLFSQSNATSPIYVELTPGKTYFVNSEIDMREGVIINGNGATLKQSENYYTSSSYYAGIFRFVYSSIAKRPDQFVAFLNIRAEGYFDSKQKVIDEWLKLPVISHELEHLQELVAETSAFCDPEQTNNYTQRVCKNTSN